MCHGEEANGSKIVLDTFASHNSDVAACSCRLTLYSSQSDIITFTRYQSMGVSHSSCGSLLTFKNGPATINADCDSIGGTMNISNVDEVEIDVTRQSSNSDSRYCILISIGKSFVTYYYIFIENIYNEMFVPILVVCYRYNVFVSYNSLKVFLLFVF